MTISDADAVARTDASDRLRGLRARAKLAEVSRVSHTLALLLVVSGCTAHHSEVTPAAGAEQECGVQIVRVGPPAPTYVGKGEGESAEAALELAWRDACSRVPEDQRTGCDGSERFVINEQSTSASFNYQNGKSTSSHTATLTLIETSAGAIAEARSEHGFDDACERARTAACIKAGAEERCLADGAYRVEWERRGPARQTQGFTGHLGAGKS